MIAWLKMRTAELCKEGILKLQLYCIVFKYCFALYCVIITLYYAAFSMHAQLVTLNPRCENSAILVHAHESF